MAANRGLPASVVLAGLLGICTAGLASSARAVDKKGELALTVSVPVGHGGKYMIAVTSDVATAPGEVGVLAHANGGEEISKVSAVALKECTGSVHNTGLSGEIVCLRIDRLPAAVDAKAVFSLGPTTELAFTVKTHQPRWIVAVVAIVGALLGAFAGYLIAHRLPSWRHKARLKSAILATKSAGFIDVDDWVAAAKPYLSAEIRATKLDQVRAARPSAHAKELTALKNNLVALRRYVGFVDADLSHPDLTLARAAAEDATLRIADALDEKGEAVTSAASRWVGLVRVVEGAAASLEEAAKLNLGDDHQKLEYQNAKFRALVFTLDNENLVREDVADIREVARHLVETHGRLVAAPSVPGALTPFEPSAPATRSAAQLLTYVLTLVSATVLCITVIATLGIKDVFGTSWDYVALAAAALAAGLASNVVSLFGLLVRK